MRYQSLSSCICLGEGNLGFLHACLRSEDSAKTPCIEESETAVLVFLLIEYWNPKQGREVCGRQNFSRITAFNSK